MKKIISPLIAALFVAAGVNAKAAVTPGTNIVTKINIQLTYTSPVSTNTTTTTKTITIGKTKVPVTYTATTYVSKSTPVTTADVMAAILAPIAVPKGAYLARVSTDSAAGDYFAVRVGNTNFYVLTGQITKGTAVAGALNGKSTSSILGDSIAAGSKQVAVLSLGLTTATLSFTAQALEVDTATGTTVTIGGFANPVLDTTYTLVGTGTDAAGANEVVTGTITANGAKAGN